nr:uncharacterized protein LOC115266450 [Aedes albopictus]
MDLEEKRSAVIALFRAGKRQKDIVRELERNPRRSATKLTEDLNKSDRRVGWILKDKLQTKPYKIQKIQDLSLKQKQERVKRAKSLLKRAAEGKLENIFTVQQFVNKQNDVLTATRRQKPESVVV